MQSDQSQTRLALAALTAAAVKTLAESEPALLPNFLRNLAAAYRFLEDQPFESVQAAETLIWTREILEKMR